MANSERDVKRSLSTEGTNLYKWFQDPEIAAPMVQAVEDVVMEPGGVIISLGASTGFLEGLIDESLQEHQKESTIICTDIIPEIYLAPDGTQRPNLNPNLKYLIQDIKQQPFTPESADVVIARSVLQYEPTISGQRQILAGINQTLKSGGCFVNQAPVFELSSERDLVDAIHLQLPKVVHALTTDETRALLTEVFDTVITPTNQTVEPIRANRAIFTQRYGPKRENFKSFGEFEAAQFQFETICTRIREMIEAVPESDRPHVWSDGEDFGWDIFYTIFQCHKQ